jgi:hypothetical protein
MTQHPSPLMEVSQMRFCLISLGITFLCSASIVLRHMFSSLFWSFSRWRPAPWCKQFSSSLFNIRCHLFDVSICGLGVQLLALVMSRSPSFVASQVHAQKPAMSSAAHMIRLLLLSVSMSTKRMWLQAVVSTPD